MDRVRGMDRVREREGLRGMDRVRERERDWQRICEIGRAHV